MTLWKVLDAYLNLGDFDDGLGGWVDVRHDGGVTYVVRFTPEVDGNFAEDKAVTWRLALVAEEAPL